MMRPRGGRRKLGCRDADAGLRGAEPGLPFRLNAKTLERGDSFTVTSDYGDIDILGTPSGTAGFDELDANADEAEFGENLTVRIASLDYLFRMKRAAGRRKDPLVWRSAMPIHRWLVDTLQR